MPDGRAGRTARVVLLRKRWIDATGEGNRTARKVEEAGRKVWLMPDQEGSLLLVLGLCQAQPQRDDDDRHLPGH